MAPVTPKDKTVAILLAVFLGLWTWVYTYKTDAWKFWVNLGVTVVTIGIWGIVAWIWAIIDVAVRSEAWYRNFPYGESYPSSLPPGEAGYFPTGQPVQPSQQPYAGQPMAPPPPPAPGQGPDGGNQPPS